ncbi:outer membrane protein assembly factor BamC [Candidatus Williamhamiltonella defendens]|uniref:outer membrane protein assembly factor BamC n=1 Tax=Candidatus Williamhamiltonella defendens TaxID=138072 RepID=UPI001F26CAFB|nr:outer membrane protein assembly factor BamC [Candidatus Hamiltonella defensa]
MFLQKLMKIKLNPKMLIIFLSLLLTVCAKKLNAKHEMESETKSAIKGEEYYLNTPKLILLKSPEGLMLPLKQSNYYVPDVTQKEPVGKQVDIRPPVQILALIKASQSQSANGISTLFLEDSPGNLWLEVLNIIKKKNLPIVNQNNHDQTLTTDWIIWKNMNENPLFSGRYEISVKQNECPKRLILRTLELHQGEKKITDSNYIQRYNNTVLNTIIEGLYQTQVDTENTRVIHKAGSLDVQLSSNENGLPNILIGASYLTVLDRLPVAIKKIGMVITESRRSKGTFSVIYKPVSNEQWEKMGIKKPGLKPGEYKLQLVDLKNYSSLQFINSNGQTLMQSDNNDLVPVFKAVFSETETEK